MAIKKLDVKSVWESVFELDTARNASKLEVALRKQGWLVGRDKRRVYTEIQISVEELEKGPIPLHRQDNTPCCESGYRREVDFNMYGSYPGTAPDIGD